jgi:16S rRNA (guanine(966)-N(2))-methyltransferase RsmD
MLRVIGGEFRSRRLLSVPGMKTRPTPDRLRETLFDILGPQVEGTVFADVCAGTGAVGIEALSRGAREAIFVEKDRRARDTILANLRSLGIEKRARIVARGSPIARGSIAAEIVFLDPPYEMLDEYAAVLEATDGTIAIAQHSVRVELSENYGQLNRYRVVRQGDNALSFYRRE